MTRDQPPLGKSHEAELKTSRNYSTNYLKSIMPPAICGLGGGHMDT